MATNSPQSREVAWGSKTPIPVGMRSGITFLRASGTLAYHVADDGKFAEKLGSLPPEDVASRLGGVVLSRLADLVAERGRKHESLADLSASMQPGEFANTVFEKSQSSFEQLGLVLERLDIAEVAEQPR